MSTVRRTILDVPSGFASAEVGLWFAGLEDLRARVLKAVADIGAEELRWQPAPGTSTIGMLLAHLAVSETHIVDVALARLATSRVREVIGIGTDDDGMPLGDDAPPPGNLDGRELPYFLDLMAKARAHTREVASRLADGDLTREVERPRQPDGSTRVFDPRWMLFHLVEHEAGHLAQILLLRHLHRKRAASRP